MDKRGGPARAAVEERVKERVGVPRGKQGELLLPHKMCCSPVLAHSQQLWAAVEQVQEAPAENLLQGRRRKIHD